MPMFEQISAQDILKWVALVFLAGFIGFFGKYLGKLVISLFQRKREDTTQAASLPEQVLKPGPVDIHEKDEPGTLSAKEISREAQKLQKKALKNEAKARKKSEKP